MAFEWEQVLKDVISEVLETMFFSMVEFEESVSENRTFDYQSEVQLLNHVGRISISLRVSEDFARMITANFLGIDEDKVSDDDLKDSLKELANMVGGGYHAHVHGAGWQLGIPTAWKAGTQTGDANERNDWLGFAFLGEPAGSAVLNYMPN